MLDSSALKLALRATWWSTPIPDQSSTALPLGPNADRRPSVSFNQTWTELQRNGNGFDHALTKTDVADLIIKFASQGESDPQKLKALVLATLASEPKGL